jgi:hypothetical protein
LKENENQSKRNGVSINNENGGIEESENRRMARKRQAVKTQWHRENNQRRQRRKSKHQSVINGSWRLA